MRDAMESRKCRSVLRQRTSSSACERMRCAAQTCRVTLPADARMSDGSGGGAKSSAGCRKGWLYERERHRKHRGRDWALWRRRWAHSEAARRGEVVSVPCLWHGAAAARTEAVYSKIYRWCSTALLSGTTPVALRLKPPSWRRNQNCTSGWCRPMEATVSGSAGIFRMKEAVVSSAVWSLARGPSARGGQTTWD
jgi:hypothetical protein